MLRKPRKEEYPEFFQTYLNKITDGNILDILKNIQSYYVKIYEDLSEEDSNYAYEEGKWSLKELLGHITDAERVFTYRALRFARNDSTKLQGFDHDKYVKEANFNERTKESLLNEYKLTNNSAIELFKSFTDEMWLRKGNVSNGSFTVRSIPYILAGHELHHLAIIKERYLKK